MHACMDGWTGVYDVFVIKVRKGYLLSMLGTYTRVYMHIFIYTYYMCIYIYLYLYMYIYTYIPLRTRDIFRGYKWGTLKINGLKTFAQDMINLFSYEHWTGKLKKNYLNFVFWKILYKFLTDKNVCTTLFIFPW